VWVTPAYERRGFARETPRAAYKLGRGKPPTNKQFKSGQSGNYRGRPRGSRNKQTLGKNFASVLQRVANSDIRVNEGASLRLNFHRRETGEVLRYKC
jgi:hypothetical protein